MATQVLLPKIGFSMNEASLCEWMVADGAVVKEGQPLYALESDKSVQEIEAPCSGTLRIVEAAGGTFNGSTHQDYTNYFDTGSLMAQLGITVSGNDSTAIGLNNTVTGGTSCGRSS